MAIAGGAVIYVKDVHKAAPFYAAVTGLARGESDDDFVALQSSTYQLVLLQMPDHIAGSIAISDPPERRESTPIKPVFVVSDIERLRESIAAYGGALNGPDRVFTFQSWLVCDGHDPEGNVFQLRQPV